MLRLNNISYSVAGRALFENANAIIPTGHKVGVVGRNGTGKTTLFRLIRGELALESGDIEITRNAQIGGVAQEAPGTQISLIDTVLAADLERTALMAEAQQAQDATRIAEIQTRLTDIDAWSAEARAATILRGLGFDTEAQARPCADFSGGWRMRVALAAVLFAQPDFLLLDEPTNYLDLEGAMWLESYLARYPHTVLVVSHDRGLLNRSVDGILHLEDRMLTYYAQPFDGFVRQRQAKHAQAQAQNAKAQARVAHLQSFVDRFRAKASKAVQAQSRLKMIERIELIATPQEAALRAFSFPQPETLSPPILRLENVAVGYNDKAVLNRINLRIDQDDRIALLGQNGQGKSTLSKLLAGKLAPLGGEITRSSKLRIGYFAQHQLEELRADESPLDHLRRALPDAAPAALRAKLAGFGLGAEQVDMHVRRLSGGQKARLSLLLATLDAPHLLILDEPTNHLDMESREALVEALTAYSGAIILVSHDITLLGLVVDRLWQVKDGRVTPYAGDLESYRAEILQKPAKEKTAKQARRPATERASRDQMQALRGDLRKAEARLEKLHEMHNIISTRLASPELYEAHKRAELDTLNSKFAELEQAITRAEDLWIQAQERLDVAQQNG